MTLNEAMDRLRAAGSEQIRAIYIRHGAGENQFGVRFGDLGKLKKEIKTDHSLALELWATGNSDARMLATMIANHKAITPELLTRWIRDAHFYGMADQVAQLAAKTQHARQLMLAWIDDTGEYVGQAGWTLVALSADDIPDDQVASWLTRIETTIHSAPNRVRYAMNNALIAIGVGNDARHALAVSAARRIGKVDVDHGETGCTTPDAEAYMEKTRAYKAKKAQGRATNL